VLVMSSSRWSRRGILITFCSQRPDSYLWRVSLQTARYSPEHRRIGAFGLHFKGIAENKPLYWNWSKDNESVLPCFYFKSVSSLHGTQVPCAAVFCRVNLVISQRGSHNVSWYGADM
jgi:hypothetical protein